jgi:hypothetical protein
MMRGWPGRGVTLALLLLTGCNGSLSDLFGTRQKHIDQRAADVTLNGAAGLSNAAVAASGTPMRDRVAVIGLLNKRNGLTHDFTMKPGMSYRLGDAIVRLRACETTAPWEPEQETGAFVQLDVLSALDHKWHRDFSGWLFKERPDRNVVQHPIYDVWVKSCAMAWPDTGPDTVNLGGPPSSSGKGAARASNATDAAGPGPDDSNPAPADSGTPDTADSSSPR